MSRPCLRVDHDDAAMTFVEIARALGYRDPEFNGKRAVFMVYAKAMSKLRARPHAFAKLRELAIERQRVATRPFDEGDAA